MKNLKDITNVPLEKLQDFIKKHKPQELPPDDNGYSPSFGDFDLEAFIKKHGIHVYKTKRERGGILHEVDCLNPEHKRKACIGKHSSGALFFKCQHESCRDLKWQDYREHFEPGYRKKKQKASSNEAAEAEKEKMSQADILIKIASHGAFLFHDETRDGFASLQFDSHREIWPLKSKFFKQWLVRAYYTETGKSPNNEAVRQALGVIEAMAVFDGPQYKLNLRIAEHDGAIYYDLANDKWQAVKITPEGWEVVDDTPVPLFRRYKNTAPQVTPERGGSLDLLKKYINLKNKSDWTLMYASDASSLIPDIPHAVPIYYGDKGSAKTTAQRVKRKIIDPAYRDTITMPTDKNEMALMLLTNYAPCFDNLDGLQAWQSDMLCQAATGGGISKRELYTDMEEVIFSFLRTPMLNGINLVASRDDLLDRSLLFKLERIDEETRMEEAVFWDEFEKDRPYILGALFDVVSKAMQIHPAVKLNSMPRMADFARWGYAVSEALGGDGEEFLEAYFKNIAGAVEEAILSEQVSAAVIEFMNDKEEWEGTATELLEKLSETPGVDTRAKSWPKRPHTLTRRLNKMKSALADYGIIFEAQRSETSRSLCLKKRKKASFTSEASEASNNGDSKHDAIHDAFSKASGNDSKASCQEGREYGDCSNHDANDAHDAFSDTSWQKDCLGCEAFHICEGKYDCATFK